VSAAQDVPVQDGTSRRPAAPRARSRRARSSFGAALGWTALNAVLPGTAFLVAGRRVLGLVTLGAFLCLLAGGLWLVLDGRQSAVQVAVSEDALFVVLGGILTLALLWIAVIVLGYRMLLPDGTSRGRRIAGALVTALIAACIAVPAAQAGVIASAQRDLIAEVFDDGESATVVDTPHPFGNKERVNVLLLGGDGGEGRDGVRTDTVIVASIDTDTGDTTLLSLPRNLQDLPFPEDSPLAEVYPDGFDAGGESESLLNAVYGNGPAQHPDILGPTDDPGADFLKLGVGEALGLTIDYHVLVNLEGFSRLVDALGGITVNVNYWVPVGGEPSTGALPNDYIEPGPNQEMDGPTALAFARGRFGLTDYDRMARQRCTIKAIIDAANPVTLLRQYEDIAATTEDIVSTDIPSSALDDFVDLAFLVQEASIRSVVFDPSVIDPAYPDYDLIRRLVEEALNPPSAPAATDDAAESSSTAPASETSPTGTSETGSSEPGTGEATGSEAESSEDPVAELADACAYDRAQAEEALAAGEPPTKDG
jgi:polyisoprenyl-teichoic acid--peptidoglycan teichoic acid transferase